MKKATQLNSSTELRLLLWNNVSPFFLAQGHGDGNNAQCAFWVVRWPCSQNGPVSDTIRRRGGYRGIFREEGVDTGAYETVVDVPESWESP